MICLNNPTGLSSRPTSIVLGELAIAAGIAGHGITLCFDAYPALLLCQMYGHFIRGVGAEKVIRIRTQRDLKALEEQMDTLRVVLIESARFLPASQWSIQMASATGDQDRPHPAVLCSIRPRNSEDDPGPTLVLRSSDTELSTIRQWLPHACEMQPRFVEVEAPDAVHYESTVAAAIEQYDNSSPSPVERRECNQRVLFGLLASASVIRSVNDDDESQQLLVNREDYDQVRACLHCPLIGSADVVCDDLAVDMVRRANVYLAIKYGRDTPEQSRLRASDGEFDQYERSTPRRDLITRREVADLGNVKSGLICRIVEHLKQLRNGYDQFVRLGMIGRPPAKRNWLDASANSLAQCLKPWSVKQVRTHFDSLRRQGLITAERRQGNGPWRYTLPEELLMNGSPFTCLPAIGV